MKAKPEVLRVLTELGRADIKQISSQLPDFWDTEVRTALKTLKSSGVIKVVAKRKPVKIPGMVHNTQKLNVYEVISA